MMQWIKIGGKYLNLDHYSHVEHETDNIYDKGRVYFYQSATMDDEGRLFIAFDKHRDPEGYQEALKALAWIDSQCIDISLLKKHQNIYTLPPERTPYLNKIEEIIYGQELEILGFPEVAQNDEIAISINTKGIESDTVTDIMKQFFNCQAFPHENYSLFFITGIKDETNLT
jgi:hypothetical protein